MKRNKYGAPVGVVLLPDEADVLRRCRMKDLTKNLPEKELKSAKKFFAERYPEKDILGEDDEETGEGDGLSREDMIAFLAERDIKVSANAKDETVKKRYDETIAAEASE